MCKEMPVIPVNKVVDQKRIIGKKWRAEEEERHKGLLTPQKIRVPQSCLDNVCNEMFVYYTCIHTIGCCWISSMKIKLVEKAEQQTSLIDKAE
jgi:hypothetical protein